MDAAEPVKSRESEGGAAGISFAEYRSHLLALEQEQRQNKQDAVLQSANFMSLVITFVFLFEMDFIAGAFPSTVSSIEYSRYSSCLSVLMFANGLLVLALALLLKVIDCVRPRIPELKDGFSSVDETTPRKDLAEREMQLRRDINEAARENLEAASEVISRTRHCTLGGMMVGALSAMVFIVNGKLLNVVVKDLQGNGSLLLPDWAWTLLGFISLLLCFLHTSGLLVESVNWCLNPSLALALRRMRCGYLGAFVPSHLISEGKTNPLRTQARTNQVEWLVPMENRQEATSACGALKLAQRCCALVLSAHRGC